MGFSMEAALVVPLCLITLSGSVIAAETLEQTTRQQALVSVAASQIQADARQLYRLSPASAGPDGPTVLVLESSPQKILVISRLAEEQIGWIRRQLAVGEPPSS